MTAPRVTLRADRDIVISRHADDRFRDRCGSDQLDEIRDDVRDAILAGRYEHRARNIWCVWTEGQTRVYPVAIHGSMIVVLTVLTSGEQAEEAA